MFLLCAAGKLAATESVCVGETEAKVYRDREVNESRHGGWLKNDAKLRDFVKDIDSGSIELKQTHLHYSEKPELEKATCTWSVQEHSGFGSLFVQRHQHLTQFFNHRERVGN